MLSLNTEFGNSNIHGDQHTHPHQPLPTPSQVPRPPSKINPRKQESRKQRIAPRSSQKSPGNLIRDPSTLTPSSPNIRLIPSKDQYHRARITMRPQRPSTFRISHPLSPFPPHPPSQPHHHTCSCLRTQHSPASSTFSTTTLKYPRYLSA